ncbi:DUF6507 family protein [Streptomyces sp. NBC_00083]|uniref:DUF6507 family protein n=1 Tax=Streptomyces sp. NBC_00083 TaxID=2975647 RepID=UPI00224CE10F|nr:DUF6507 family protein [Streptomyces sp. NBC_00083]MCX5388085.1 DUF6507 family protein [Streptomyces sp. NBC_00083]
MTGWDIKPAGVSGVLQKTATAAEAMSKAGTAMQESLKSAATSAGTISGPTCGEAPMGPVGGALGEFMQHKAQELGYIAVRTQHSLQGAYDATTEYVKGDLDMAANKQSQAVKEPVVNDKGQELGPDGKPVEPNPDASKPEAHK